MQISASREDEHLKQGLVFESLKEERMLPKSTSQVLGKEDETTRSDDGCLLSVESFASGAESFLSVPGGLYSPACWEGDGR